MSALPELPRTGQVPGRARVRYAFSTRADGTQSSSIGEGDSRTNRRRVLDAAGLPSRVEEMRQVHGRTVRVARRDTPGDRPEADALVTADAGVTLCVMAADCVPVLLADGDVISAVHAGRAGMAAGVLQAAVSAMADVEGSDGDLVAIIGPAIGGCCYEVPAAMAAEVDAIVPGAAATTSWGTASIDLPGAAAAILEAAGAARVHRVGGCTRCDQGEWFSHRAVGDGSAAAGRHAGYIGRLP